MPHYIHLEEVDSTNSYLKRILSNQEVLEDTVVTTNFQTGGRGQQGNSWESEKERNLTFSILLHPDFIAANKQFIISQIISLAIKDILEKYTDGISIKWPNDIYWNNYKICGILIENSLMGNHIQYSIAGIGININQSEFISNAPNPISLKQITGNTYNTKEILSLIVNRIDYYYNSLKLGNSEQIISLYKESLFRRSEFYFYKDENGMFEARISDIEPSGVLVLETKNGVFKKYAFKEVQFIL